jgi:hypothetical protein
MTQPAGIEGEFSAPFNEAFDKIGEGIRKAVDEFNNLVDQINRWSWLLGGAAMLWIKHNLDRVRDGLQMIIDRVRYAFEHQFPVLALITASFRWVNDVKTPISELSILTTKPANDNFYKWTGDAYSAYNAKAIAQKGAVDESVLKAEFISQWLFKIAKANVEFAVALGKIVTDVAAALTQAAVDAATVIDIPWAIDALAAQTGKLVKGGLDTLLSIGQRFVDALGRTFVIFNG